MTIVEHLDVQRILDVCHFNQWRFRVASMCDGTTGVALEVEAVHDNFSDGRVCSFTRCVSIVGEGEAAVVDAAFRAVMRHLEHEAAEQFRFGNLRPFDPHKRVVPDEGGGG